MASCKKKACALQAPLPGWAGKEYVADPDEIQPRFHRLHRWDENSVPTLDRLKSLGSG
jgi:hypothetical protein